MREAADDGECIHGAIVSEPNEEPMRCQSSESRDEMESDRFSLVPTAE